MVSVTTVGDAEASIARRAWYRKHAKVIGVPRDPNGKRRLLVDVSHIAKQDARTGIQRVVRGIWAVLLNRASEFELVPVVASRRRGYSRVSYFEEGTFGEPHSSSLPVATREGDIFLGLDLSAHLLPLHSSQV